MKIDNKTILLGGGLLVAYLIYRKFRYGTKTPKGTLVKMCTFSTCGKCYCGEGQQPFMKVLSQSGCDYQLQIINHNSGHRPKGDVFTWTDMNCSKPGIMGAGGLVKLSNEDLMEMAKVNAPQVAGGNCGSTCGGYENPNYNSALPYSETNKPCICEGPGTANPYPKSQADCPPDTQFSVPMTIGMGAPPPPQCTPCTQPKSADDCPPGTTYRDMRSIMHWLGPPPPCGFGQCMPNTAKAVPLRPKSQADCPGGLTFQPAIQIACFRAPCPPGIPAKCV